MGEPDLNVGLVRGLCRLAGVPIHTPDDDACWVGDDFLCLHSEPGGGTAVHLSESACIFDLVYGETLASEGYGARYTIGPKSTRLLVTGARSVVAEFGAEFDGAPAGLGPDEIPVVKPYPIDRSARADVDRPPADDVALFDAAVARMEASHTAGEGRDTPVEDSAAGTSRSSRRRRRRRGGRGAETGDGSEIPADLSDTLPADGTVSEGDRSRPTLAELLPESEVSTGVELPPIPEEFKPMDDATLGAAPTGRRRRRRGRGGRGGGGGEDGAGSGEPSPDPAED